jgi:hypothetical protein
MKASGALALQILTKVVTAASEIAKIEAHCGRIGLNQPVTLL